MILELGNDRPVRETVDGAPGVTTIHIPEFDDGSTHPDAVYEGGRHPCADEFEKDGKTLKKVGKLVKPGPRLGGYTWEPGLKTSDFQKHLSEAVMFGGGVTRLPEHEAALIAHFAWQAEGRGRPKWLRVRSHEETHGKDALDSAHPKKNAKALEDFLHEHFGTNGAGIPADVEDRYWTQYGAPGQAIVPDPRPNLQGVFTNAGRVMANKNDGGGQVGFAATAAGMSASSTTLTDSGQAWSTNQWAGHRVLAQPASGLLAWANVLSNTGTVLTVDRWYTAATPGGSASGTPGTSPYVILDGGSVSSWFVALANTNITPAAADTALSTEYTTGGMKRKIAPYAQTSGVATRAITLTPVYTADGSEGAQTFYAIGVFASMVSGSGLMKFETSLSAAAAIAASGDQVTVTETISGS